MKGLYKKIAAAVLALVLAAGMLAGCGSESTEAGETETAGTSAEESAAKSGDIIVLYTNDVHCAVDDNLGYQSLAAY